MIAWMWLACVRSTQPSPPIQGEPHETRDTLVIAIPKDAAYLSPIIPESAVDSRLLELLGMPLLEPNFECRLSFSPGLAASWSHSEDGRTLSMSLRDDLRWEDGVSVTARDIALTYDWLADPFVGSPWRESLERMEPDGRPRVLDDTHIEWHFTEPYDPNIQLAQTSIGLAPAHRIERLDRATLRGADLAPLSYGPFRLARWEHDQRLVFEPNPHFTGPREEKPRLDQVIFRVIPDYSARLLELESGNVDLMDSVQAADVERLQREHDELRIVNRGLHAMDYVAWNLSNPMFADADTRRALAAAIDVDTLLKELLGSESGEIYGQRAVSTVTPALCDFHNDDIVPIPHDRTEAERLLALAGWQDSDGDGLLDRDGRPFSFSLLFNAGNQRRARAAEGIKAQLAALGIEVRIDTLETSSFFDRMQRRDYEAALAGWGSGLFADLSPLWACDRSSEQTTFNFTGYCDPEVDALIAKAKQTLSGAEPLWREAQARIYEAQPYLFLWWMDDLVAVHRRFEDTTIDILSPWRRIQRWEVPPEQVKYPREGAQN